MSSMETVVLCVEDDPHTLDLLTYILENAGFRVVRAENGSDALALSIEKKPALILLDLLLPDILGDEVCRRIRSHPATRITPIIMLSVQDEEEAKVTCLESGADDYMTKPFSVRILIARIHALLRRRTMMEEVGF